MSSLLNTAKEIISNTPVLAHWTEEIIKAKVRLYRSRSENFLRLSIERDAREINTNPMVIDSLPEELRDAARPPQEAPKAKAPKAKAKSKRAIAK